MKTPVGKPAPSPARWDGLIGEYGWEHDVLYILEKGGKLHAQIEWFFDYPLTEVAPDRFRFPDDGLYAGETVVFTRDASGGASQVEAASVVFKRGILTAREARHFGLSRDGRSRRFAVRFNQRGRQSSRVTSGGQIWSS